MRISIKISLDKFRFLKGFKRFLEMVDENGLEMLPITFEHAMIVSTLEFIHRDPFYRHLISQCKNDNLILATKDENKRKYNIQTIW